MEPLNTIKIFSVLTYDDLSKQLKLNEQFIKMLQSSIVEKLIIISVNGQAGRGKSTFLSLIHALFKSIQKQNDDTYLIPEQCTFQSSDGSKSFTKGIDTLSEMILFEDRKEGIILMDMEGIDALVSQENQDDRDEKLLKCLTFTLLASSVFVYLSPIRLKLKDIKELGKVQLQAEWLKNEIKIDYPKIFFLLTETSELKLKEVEMTSGSKLYTNSAKLCVEQNEIEISEEDQSAFKQHLQQSEYLKSDFVKNLIGSVFPKINSKLINITSPRDVLANDSLMKNHLESLIAKFQTCPKLRPGTKEILCGVDYADFLIKVVEAINKNKFDLLTSVRANTLESSKKIIIQLINDFFASQIDSLIVSKLDDMGIDDLKTVIAEIETIVGNYWKKEKKNFRDILSKKIQIEEEIDMLLNDFKYKIFEIKNTKLTKLVSDFNNIKLSAINNEITQMTNSSRDEENTIQLNKIKLQNEKKRLEFEYSKTQKEIEDSEELINQNTKQLIELDSSCELLKSQLNQIQQLETLHELDKEDDEALQKKIHIATEKLDSINKEINEHTNALQAINKNIRAMTYEYEEKLKETDENKTRYRQANESYLKNMLENTKLKNEIFEVDSNIAEILRDKENLKNKKEDLKKQQETKEIQLKELENKIDAELLTKRELEEKMESIKPEIKNFSLYDEMIKKTQLTSERDELKDKVDELEKEKNSLQKAFAEYKSKYNAESKFELETKHSIKKKRYDEITSGDLTESLIKAKSELSTLEAQQNILENDIKDIQDDINRKMNVINKKEEIEKALTNITMEKFRQDVIEEENKKINLEIAEMKKEKEKLYQHFCDLKQQFAKLQEQENQMIIEQKNIEGDINRISVEKKQEKEKLEGELNQLKIKIKKEFSELKDLSKSYSDLTACTGLLGNYITAYQQLFDKMYSTKTNTGKYDQYCEKFIEDFSKMKTNQEARKAYANAFIKALKVDIGQEIEEFFKYLTELEAHPFFIDPSKIPQIYEKSEVFDDNFADDELLTMLK